MKSTVLFAAAAAGLFLSSVSCERHSWEETKKLHETHGGHGHAEHGDGHHGEEKHDSAGHGEGEAH